MAFSMLSITLLTSFLTSESISLSPKESDQDILYYKPENDILDKESYNTRDFVDIMYQPADPKEMKKAMDEFTMVKKKTFVVTEKYSMNKKDTLDDFEENVEYNENDFDKKELSWEVRCRENININHFNKYIFNRNVSKEMIRTDFKAIDDIENDHIKKREEMWKLLSKQNELIEKLASRYHEMILEEAKRPKHESFNKILRSVDIKKQLRQLNNKTTTTNNTTFTQTIPTTETTTETNNNITTSTINNDTGPPSTIKTIFDETEIKNALKKDPLVQRILKMANKKKEDYFKKMKEMNKE